MMRAVPVVIMLAVAGCGSVKPSTADANLDADIDAAIDAAMCQPKVLLAGGSDVAAQGWSVVSQPPAQLTNGPDYANLKTTTNMGATSGGQLLLNYPGALETGKPFKIQIVMLVESVNPHNLFDSAAAIMGSYTPPFGVGDDRGEMIYLDADTVGWGDDTQAFTANIANNAYHTYELSVGAAGVARFTVDGMLALTRNGFTFNGAIAIGDQTNDANVDSTLRIRSVTRLCPGP